MQRRNRHFREPRIGLWFFGMTVATILAALAFWGGIAWIVYTLIRALGWA